MMRVHVTLAVHATSKSASGPFSYKDTPVGPFSCNPHVIELSDSSLALFHIGAPFERVPF